MIKKLTDTLPAALLGIIVGAMAAYLFKHFFGPAENTAFDATYQSRLDRALSEGQRAAAEREIELRRQLAQARGQQDEGVRRWEGE